MRNQVGSIKDKRITPQAEARTGDDEDEEKRKLARRIEETTSYL